MSANYSHTSESLLSEFCEVDFDLPEQEDQCEPWQNPLAVCWRRKTTIFTFFSLGCLYSLIYWQFQGETYQASAQLLLLAGNAGERSAAQDRTETLIEQLQSPLITKQLVQKSLSGFFPPEEKAKSLAGRFKITRKGSLLTMSFSAPSAELSRQQLQAILEGCRDYLKNTPQSSHRAACDQLANHIEQTEDLLSKKIQRFVSLLRPTPFSGATRSVQDQLSERQQKIEGKRQDLEIRKVELQQQLLSLSHSPDAEAGGTLAIPSSGSSPLELQAIRNILERELRERHVASQARGYQSEVRRAALETQHAREVYALVGRRSTLEANLAEIEQSLTALEELLSTEKNWAQQWSRLSIESNRQQTEIFEQKEILSSLKKELHHNSIALKLEAYQLRLIAPIELGVSRSLRTIFLGYIRKGILGGLFLGLLVAFGQELMDRGFRTPHELTQRLGVPLLGELPFISASAAEEDRISADGLLADYQFSQSKLAEQFRKIRTALMYGAPQADRQILLITSSQPGMGSSLTAANLAAAAAQAGKKTLLIDANLKHPELHRTFGMDCSAGLAAVLDNPTTWQDSVQATAIANLDLLPSGQMSGVSTELLSTPHWGKFLNAAKKSYDYLIIDAPAMLTDPDPLLIAHSVDRIVLLLSVGRRSRTEAEEVFDLLGALSPRVIGVVMNNLKNHQPVWRTYPLEKKQPQQWTAATAIPAQRVPNRSSTPTSESTSKDFSQRQGVSTCQPPVEHDIQEFESMLHEMSTEIKEVVADSQSINLLLGQQGPSQREPS